MNLRKEAKGRECQIRIPGVCNRNPEKVVLCHLHKPSIGGGMSLKGNDLIAAYGCNSCHDAVDGRSTLPHCAYLNHLGLTIMFYEAIFRTQAILLKEDKIGVLK